LLSVKQDYEKKLKDRADELESLNERKDKTDKELRNANLEIDSLKQEIVTLKVTFGGTKKL
jgi:peptidoglycan hydrolase CwlO-like protein